MSISKWVWAGVVLAAIVLLLVVLGPGREMRNATARARYPHVVLITIDTLHVLETGVYNPEIQFTPNLVDFARDGLVFQNAYTPVPITLPSHTDLMSGMSPLKHSVMANGDQVPAGLTTLAEVFKEAGYRTAAFVSLGVLMRAFQLDQGFDTYVDPFGDRRGRWYRRADEVFEPVKSWLEENYSEPFFIWVHYSDPHEPYLTKDAPPDTRLTLDGKLVGEWTLADRAQVDVQVEVSPGKHRLTWTSLREPRPDDVRHTGMKMNLFGQKDLAALTSASLPSSGDDIDLEPSWSLDLANAGSEAVTLKLGFGGRLQQASPSEVAEYYPQEVEWADRHVGKLRALVDSLGIGEETLWVIVSDHGEGLYRHDYLGHSAYVFEDQLRILWQMQGPGVPKGKIVDSTPVMMMDVAPTLLDLVGLAVPSGVEGHSLVECWQDGDCPERKEWWAYGLNHGNNRLAAAAGYKWPYKWMWKRQLDKAAYHLGDDPWEENDLLGPPPHPQELVDLAREFQELRPNLAFRLTHRHRVAGHADQLEMLKALGYVGTQDDH
jgi:arylsulfatase A-like enzyme